MPAKKAKTLTEIESIIDAVEKNPVSSLARCNVEGCGRYAEWMVGGDNPCCAKHLLATVKAAGGEDVLVTKV